MIRRYNRSQLIKAIFLFLGGLGCCWLAYLFFRYVPEFVAWQGRYALSERVCVAIGLAGVAVTWFSGYRTWKQHGGLFSYHESGLYHDLGTETSGAFIADFYAHRVTGPAYLLGQIFMAGPQWILRALTLIYGRIPQTHGMESRLQSVLATLRTARKWQGLHEYPDDQTEILYLAQMGLIDFSGYDGRPRFKASGDLH